MATSSTQSSADADERAAYTAGANLARYPERYTTGIAEVSAGTRWALLRGFFDVCGEVSRPEVGELSVKLPHSSRSLQASFLELIGSPPDKVGKRVSTWRGPSALDLLCHLYDEGLAPSSVRERRGSKLEQRYRDWCQRVALFSEPTAALPAPVHTLRIERLSDAAQTPSKERVSDSGYDLTLIDIKKRLGKVVLYGTGIKVAAPEGWYVDVVPRSSIIKRGYMLANNVGIIDRAYRGELMVPLVKVDPDAPELELPARVAQMIPRPIVHFPVEVVDSLDETHRGGGGFGSTGG